MDLDESERDLVRTVVRDFSTPYKKELEAELIIHAAREKQKSLTKADHWPTFLAAVLWNKARNLKRDWQRRDKKIGPPITDATDIATTEPSLLDRLADQQAVRHAMKLLPPKVQHYWRLRAEDKSKVEAARLSGIHRNTAPAWERLIEAALHDQHARQKDPDCAVPAPQGPIETKTSTMTGANLHRASRARTFVMVPTALVQELMRQHLSGLQYRIIWWTITRTFGWHRSKAMFSWYGVAQELAADRGATVRAGNKLVATDFVVIGPGRRIGFPDRFAISEAEKAMPSGSDPEILVPNDSSHTDAKEHRKRCQTASDFRRAKDSSKDKNNNERGGKPPQGEKPRDRKDPNNAGAARPIPGKYRHVDLES